MGILRVARAHLVTALRERVTLFWFLIFPVFLLVLLSAVFGRIGEGGGMQFEIALVDLDSAGEGSFSSIVVGVFEELSSPREEGKESLFALHRPAADEDPAAFLADETARLQRGQRAAVVVIPEGFSVGVQSALMAADGGSPLVVRYSEGSAASEVAAGIIEGMVAGVDREIQRRAGRLSEAGEVVVSDVTVGGGEGSEYIDFLLPGIILMGFFVNGLFGIPGSILFARDRKVLRRYWVTPLSVPRYLLGLSLGHLTLCAIQFALLFIIGRFALGARIAFSGLDTIGILVLAAATFMAFGFLIASLARTGNAGMAIANVLNMPMMFLSGLFFPVAGLPAFLRAIIRVNPMSYLAEGLRASLGVQAATQSILLLVGVPLLWILVSAAIAARRLRWDVAR
ncbi:MAG: ABC transporter permease [Candidatus Bipolaricaulota bacterium]|nr:MAG: ABC transporter permease [Candidatus Bipolaricaulota bacterium]